MDDLIETMPGANTAPPVLLLQGTGGTNLEMLNFGRRLVPQSPLITIAGRQGSGAQRQYYRQTAATPADPQVVEQEASWLGEQVRAVCDQQSWEADRLITVGYSNGAAMAAYAIRSGWLPGHVAVLFHPLWLSAPINQSLNNYKIWLSAGQHDPLVNLATVQRVAADCRQRGAQTTIEVTGGTHHLTPGEVLAAHDWVARQVANEEK